MGPRPSRTRLSNDIFVRTCAPSQTGISNVPRLLDKPRVDGSAPTRGVLVVSLKKVAADQLRFRYELLLDEFSQFSLTIEL